MTKPTTCPVCQNANGGTCEEIPAGMDSSFFNCDVCGKFAIARLALYRLFDLKTSDLTSVQRAALSHSLRTAARESEPLTITTDWFKRIEDLKLPTPAIQAANIIRYVGDEITRTGETLGNIPVFLYAIAGSPNREFASQIVKELCSRFVLQGNEASDNDGTDFLNISLTLEGWEQYELEKQGKIAGKRGFIAMKFDDVTLEPFVKDVIKPAVKDGIGYELVDMRDVSRAGVIDNIMRTEIRDAAFVIVDVTLHLSLLT